jgi:hypothetical protein
MLTLPVIQNSHPSALRSIKRHHLHAALLAAALFAIGWAHNASADKKTVCTITVNSPDEKEAFRRSLPSDKFTFVELVERGRADC